MPIEQAGRVGMIGRQRHDRLAGLAGADVGRRDTLDLVLNRHGQLPNAFTPMISGCNHNPSTR